MMFLKITRKAKGFLTRFGWLLAELLFVFIGMYGAFLLERMHEENLDALRERQILQALIDEFHDYEKELSDFKHWLDEGYAKKFFQSYSLGEKPFPPIIPSGGMGNVNTGIWEAMLQSGGIELLEMEMILEIQSFFKKLQDVLDLYSRFERLTETMILPESDRNATFFYEEDGIVLRNKYKWYVNSLFTLGMSLGDMSAQAGRTKSLLIKEFKSSFPDFKINTQDSAEFLMEEEIVESENDDNESESDEISPSLPPVREKDPRLEIAVINNLFDLLKRLNADLATLQNAFDEKFAIPFFTDYTEGNKPKPMTIQLDHNLSLYSKEWKEFFNSKEVKNLDLDLIEKTQAVFNFLEGCHNEIEKFVKLSEIFSKTDSELGLSQYYLPTEVELKEDYMWFPNQMFSIGNNLGSLSENILNLNNEVSERHSKLIVNFEIDNNSSSP